MSNIASERDDRLPNIFDEIRVKIREGIPLRKTKLKSNITSIDNLEDDSELSDTNEDEWLYFSA